MIAFINGRRTWAHRGMFMVDTWCHHPDGKANVLVCAVMCATQAIINPSAHLNILYGNYNMCKSSIFYHKTHKLKLNEHLFDEFFPLNSNDRLITSGKCIDFHNSCSWMESWMSSQDSSPSLPLQTTNSYLYSLKYKMVMHRYGVCVHCSQICVMSWG